MADGKYFKQAELACKCGCGMGVSDALITRLDDLRAAFGKPITVTSGARCLAHNTKVGGHPNSSHTRGEAADIRPSAHSETELNRLYSLCDQMFQAVGDGRPRGFIHVDLRADKKRRWMY
jgi:uncharacterized protein YcbK (DUF882 family)